MADCCPLKNRWVFFTTVEENHNVMGTVTRPMRVRRGLMVSIITRVMTTDSADRNAEIMLDCSESETVSTSLVTRERISP